MKVIIKDSQILNNVEPEVLKAHLTKEGWHEQGRIYNNTGEVWRLKKGSEKDEFEILLPLQKSLGDYAARISDALKTLEIVENRSQFDILSELITTAYNITIQGVVSKIQIPNSDKLSGEVTLLGIVVDKLREVKTELTNDEYNRAIKAYQERLPVVCTGDLIKQGDTFRLKNLRNFSLDNVSD